MANLSFSVDVEWTGTGREGTGRVTMNGETVNWSVPSSMGGKGEGSSPEEFLMAGVSSCYSATLYGVLKKAGLPVDSVRVAVEATITDYPLQSKFAKLVVSPEIRGGDDARIEEYRASAQTARERCFIGKTIAGNVEYEVGTVSVG